MTQHERGDSANSRQGVGGGHGLGASRGGPRLGSAARVSLGSAGELADALPYLLGFRPDDSIVAVGLHGEGGHLGGRIRSRIPADADTWPELCAHIAACLEDNAGRGGPRPGGAVLFLCRDPDGAETGTQVMERLRPLAQQLRVACGQRDMPVYEALCVSAGRYWSYCCPEPCSCPVEGRPIRRTGVSTMAVAATYSGMRRPPSQRAIEARLTPLGPPLAGAQEAALDTAGGGLLPRMLAEEERTGAAEETVRLTAELLERFREAAPARDGDDRTADAHDDALLSVGEAAAAVVGLQDRGARDRVAAWMEGGDAEPALRLWRALARRCVGAYAEYGAAPLTLAGWVAWSSGDEPAARITLEHALTCDPGYVFAQLLHRALNDGLDPEDLRRCLRTDRTAGGGAERSSDDRGASPPAGP